MFHVEHSQIISNSVSRETLSFADDLISHHHSELQDYLDQLLWWNDRINLVSRNVSRGTVWEHIRHSLLLSHFDLFKQSKIVVDAGTGGGLPGMPLAITHPKKHFVLNDLVSKKCMVMKQMAKKIELENVGIVDGSIENFTLEEQFLLISKHAFKINELNEMTSALPWQQMVFYKGTDFEEELTGLPEFLEVKSYDLSHFSEFYQGKALVIVAR